MPAGQYQIFGDDDVVAMEAFRSAPGPAGWRYFSTVSWMDGTTGNVDLSVNASWEPVRVRVQAGAHHTLLMVRGPAVNGVLDDEEVSLPYESSMSIEFPSPAFLAATARRLGSETAELEVLALDPETLRAHRETHRYEFVGAEAVETPVGTFEAQRWHFIAPRPRFSRSFWVAGDVCVAAEDLYELVTYEALANGPVPRV